MNYSETREEAESHANTAFALMAQYGVPATPPNFTVWYAYASGGNGELTQAVDALIDRGEPLTAAQNEELYETHFGFANQAANVQKTSKEIQDSIRQVLQVLGEASDGASSYRQALQENVGSLHDDSSIADLRQVVETVVGETRKVIEHNRMLETELRDSSAKMDTLRQNLEVVRKEALTDALTGVANRKQFDIILRSAAMEATRNNTPLSLIMVDIDHFKKFNDTYGHQTGDVVLRLVAQILRTNVEGGDTAARYGGEEFAVILPDTALSPACVVGERLRRTVAGKRMRKKSDGADLGNITLSLGVATFRRGETPEQLVKRADQCLYVAKRKGRNQVVAENQLQPNAAA